MDYEILFTDLRWFLINFDLKMLALELDVCLDWVLEKPEYEIDFDDWRHLVFSLFSP